jgi:hypothetical protein
MRGHLSLDHESPKKQLTIHLELRQMASLSRGNLQLCARD